MELSPQQQIKPRREMTPNKYWIKNNQKRHHNDYSVIDSFLWDSLLERGFNRVSNYELAEHNFNKFLCEFGFKPTGSKRLLLGSQRQRHSQRVFWCSWKLELSRTICVAAKRYRLLSLPNHRFRSNYSIFGIQCYFSKL